MRHHAKFCRNRSNRCYDMAIFRFFQDGVRPPSLDFDACIGHTLHRRVLFPAPLNTEVAYPITTPNHPNLHILYRLSSSLVEIETLNFVDVLIITIIPETGVVSYASCKIIIDTLMPNRTKK